MIIQNSQLIGKFLPSQPPSPVIRCRPVWRSLSLPLQTLNWAGLLVFVNQGGGLAESWFANQQTQLGWLWGLFGLWFGSRSSLLSTIARLLTTSAASGVTLSCCLLPRPDRSCWEPRLPDSSWATGPLVCLLSWAALWLREKVPARCGGLSVWLSQLCRIHSLKTPSEWVEGRAINFSICHA